MFTAVKPELLKTSALNVISKIINFECMVLVSVCPQMVYVPMLVKERIIFRGY